MHIDELVTRISTLPNCTVLPPSGLPRTNEEHEFTDEIIRFYELCGGVTLFKDAPYSVRILTPDEVIRTTPIFWDDEILDAADESIEIKVSSSWYVIVDLHDSNYLSIDLNRSRLGRCYQTFWDSYAVIGETPIVASSFSDLLERLLENQGDYWYFLKNDFVPLGDAYDGVELD
jgi:antitoxin YokJ